MCISSSRFGDICYQFDREPKYWHKCMGSSRFGDICYQFDWKPKYWHKCVGSSSFGDICYQFYWKPKYWHKCIGSSRFGDIVTNLIGNQGISKSVELEADLGTFVTKLFVCLFVTDVTVLSRRVPFKGTKSIANADTEFYCSGSIMAVPN